MGAHFLQNVSCKYPGSKFCQVNKSVSYTSINAVLIQHVGTFIFILSKCPNMWIDHDPFQNI